MTSRENSIRGYLAMSRHSVRSYVFMCDECKEGEFVSYNDAKDMPQAQRIVRNVGWYSGVGNTEYCPDCAFKMLAPRDAGDES